MGLPTKRGGRGSAAASMMEDAQGATPLALAHYQFGMVRRRQALIKHKTEICSCAHDEFSKAVASAAKFPSALFAGALSWEWRPADDPQRQ